MNQALHVFRKDLRRLRWMLAAWCACILARLLVATRGADFMFTGFDAQFIVAELNGALGIVEALLLGILVSRLIHDEPLVGYDAFWLTRPLRRRSLMASKVALAALFFVLLPVVANLVAARYFHARGTDLVTLTPVSALSRALWLSLLLAVAVMTPSFTKYVLAIVGIVAAFASTILLATVVSLLGHLGEQAGPPVLPDPTPAFIAELLVIAAAAATIVCQYRYRRLGRSLIVLAAGLLLAFFVPPAWPWSFMRLPAAAAELAPANAASILVTPDPSVAPTVSDEFMFRRKAPAMRTVSIRVNVSGLPDDIAVRAVGGAQSTLAFKDRTIERSPDEGFAVAVTLVHYGSASPVRTVSAALGGVRVLPANSEDEAQWAQVLRISEEEFAQYAHEPGRLTSTLSFVLQRTVAIAVLPLSRGAAIRLGSMRVEIVDVLRRPTGCTVYLRQSRVDSLFSLPFSRGFSYLLLNGGRREAVRGIPGEIRPQTSMIGGALGIHMAEMRGSGFSLEQYELAFPMPNRPGMPPIMVDAAWMAGAELAILEAQPAGVVRRQIEIADFRMKP